MKRIWTVVVIALLAVSLAAVGCGGSEESQSGNDQKQEQDGQDQATLVFSDPELQFQLTRALGDTAYGEADIGECLSTAERITEGDVNSWYEEWYATAERVRGIAEESLAAGHEVSAREAYLRASTYYAMAEFYLHGDPTDPRIRESSAKSRDCFAQAAAALYASHRARAHTLRKHHPSRLLLYCRWLGHAAPHHHHPDRLRRHPGGALQRGSGSRGAPRIQLPHLRGAWAG